MWVLQQVKGKYCWQQLCQKRGVHGLKSNTPRYFSHSWGRGQGGGGHQTSGGAEAAYCDFTAEGSMLARPDAGFPSPLPHSTPDESCSPGGRITSA